MNSTRWNATCLTQRFTSYLCFCCAGGPRVSFPDYPSIMRHSLNEPGYGRCGPCPRLNCTIVAQLSQMPRSQS